MKIEKSLTQTLVLTELEGLDPVTVHLRDLAPGRGVLTIECYGKSWTGHWSAMGVDRKVAKFVTDAGPDYLIGSMAPCLRSVQFSADELVLLLKRCIIDRRRGRNYAEWFMLRDLEKEQARSLFNRVHDLDGSTPGECWQHSELLESILGTEWWHRADDCTEKNPDYYYLERIILAAQEGIKQAQKHDEETAA